MVKWLVKDKDFVYGRDESKTQAFWLLTSRSIQNIDQEYQHCHWLIENDHSYNKVKL